MEELELDDRSFLFRWLTNINSTAIKSVSLRYSPYNNSTVIRYYRFDNSYVKFTVLDDHGNEIKFKRTEETKYNGIEEEFFEKYHGLKIFLGWKKNVPFYAIVPDAVEVAIFKETI